MTVMPVSRLSLSTALTVGLIAVSIRAQKPPAPSVDLVEIDVTVLDSRGKPVHDLTKEGFLVKEDGRPIELTTFEEVSPQRATEDEDAPSLVLLLDDAGVSATGTRAIQTIAHAFVTTATSRDRVSVVRLHTSSDEPFGDRRTAENRIVEFRAASHAFVDWLTPQDSLQRMADLARQLESASARRKIIVCVGSPVVCNAYEPVKASPRSLWPFWVDVLGAAARTNTVIYAVVPGRAGLRGGGLVEFTGGEVFATTYDVGPAIDRIFQDAANYYVLGYWPQPDGKPRALHSIEVKSPRRGLKVRARRARGP